MPLCFFNRCKPQGADAIDLVLRINRVFLGYPPYKEGQYASSTQGNVHDTIYDLSVVESPTLDLTFLPNSKRRNYEREVSKNANLIREVVQSAPYCFVIVPRPEAGLCYLGRVHGFELVNEPPWFSDYRDLRHAQQERLKRQDEHVSDDRDFGDIVQTFVVEAFKPIPLFAVPAWIRHQLFCRATAGRIHPKLDSHDPYRKLSEVYTSSDRQMDLAYTDDLVAIEERLLAFTTPFILEHLFCELLQLENPEQYWWHVGGPGDGGVDALGFNRDGQIVGAAQCKLAALGKDTLIGLGQEMAASFRDSTRREIFVCSLYADLGEVRDQNVHIYGRKGLAALLLRNRERSIFASMLGLRLPASLSGPRGGKQDNAE